MPNRPETPPEKTTVTAAPTDRLDRPIEVTIDPIRLIARVGAGVCRRDVFGAAAEYGLSPVLRRRHGYAADRVRLVEIVSLDRVQ